MSFVTFAKKTIQEFSTDKGSQLAAAFAYTGVFALAPALIIAISVAGILFGQKAAEGQLFSNFSDVVGPSTASTVQHAIAHTHQSSHSSLALVIGLVGSLLAASALASQLQNSFDTIFSVKPSGPGGIKKFFYVKLKNMLVIVLGGIFIAASVIFTTVLSAAGQSLAKHLGMPASTLQVLNILISFIVFSIFIYFVYSFLPDIRLPRKVLLTASLIVGVLFLVGKIALGWVIGRNGTASAYGAAASLITLLLWFYYTGQILFIGAEGIKVYAANHGLELRLKKYNVRQKTLNINAKNDLAGQAAEKFARGFTKKVRGEK